MNFIEYLIKHPMAFWFNQIGLWLLYGIANLLVRSTYVHHDFDGPPISIVFVNTLLGFLISSALGYAYRNIPRSQPGKVLLLAIVISIVSAIIWTFTGNLIDSYIDPIRWQDAPFSMYFLGILNSAFILLSWSAGYFSFRYYQLTNEQRLAMSELKHQAQQTQMQMLRYQLNPHFMFNTLTSISALIRDHNNEAADEMVERLGDLLRQSLQSSPIDMVTMEEELATLDMYVQLEKVRFQERLEFSCDRDGACLSVLVPSFLLQPLVENSIKHVIAQNELGGSIHLLVKVEGGRLLIKLTDSGSGDVDVSLKETSSTGIGLQNVEQRLANIYQQDYSFEVSLEATGAFVVNMNLPAYTPDE